MIRFVFMLPVADVRSFSTEVGHAKVIVPRL